ncbi:sodium:solute symporter [Opitutaceae bacterium TAV5]|nr:sodium:solute symporter [Opitutaceae bacterium TAV5]
MHPLDISIILLFFVVMGLMGAYFARKTKTTDSYFLGNNLPGWAIGLSMLATSISSVTFLAFPAAAFVLDWRQVVPNLANPLFAVLAIWLFVPFFRNTAKTTAYEYLQKRFGEGARLYAAIMFLVSQCLRLGSILYLLVIPMQMMTGIPPAWIILITGGIAALYTIMGGMSASVWTDVVQAFILYLGGFVAVAIMIYDIPGGLGEIIRVAEAHDKFSMGPMRWDLSERTFWTMAILGLTHWVGGYVADQNVVQRYLAAKSTAEARHATLICALMSLPTWLFFFFIGTCLFAYYTVLPSEQVAGLPADYVFPHFIMSRLPAGLSGLVIAGVLSAAIGSLSSSLNAFSTVSTVDILQPHVFRNRSDRFYARLARVMTAVGMVAMFAVGYGFLFAEKESFLDLSFKVVGLIGGVTVCFFMLGFFAPRVSRKVLWQAFSVAFALNVYLAMVEWGFIPNVLNIKIHAYWVSTLVIWVMIVLALVLARIQRVKPDRRPGMTLVGGRVVAEGAGQDT